MIERFAGTRMASLHGSHAGGAPRADVDVEGGRAVEHARNSLPASDAEAAAAAQLRSALKQLLPGDPASDADLLAVRACPRARHAHALARRPSHTRGPTALVPFPLAGRSAAMARHYMTGRHEASGSGSVCRPFSGQLVLSGHKPETACVSSHS